MKKKYLYILLPVLVICIGTLAVLLTIMLFKPNKNSIYFENISSAKKYMSMSDYNNAILYYKEAIKANAYDEEAYIGLADAYISSGQKANAIKTLEVGYERTKSEKIKQKLDQLLKEDNTGNEDNNAEAEKMKQEENKELRINNTLFDTLSSYTYGKYKDIYSINTQDTTSEGDVIVKCVGLDLDFYYNNKDDVINIDSETGNPKSDAYPYKIVAPSVKSLFSGIKEKISADEIRKLPGVSEIRVLMSDEIRNNVLEFKYKDCRIYIESDDKGVVNKLDGWNKIIPEVDNKGGEYTFKGIIKNAVDYSGVISTVNIYAREGINNKNGEIKAQTKSSNGEFVLNVPIGDYTLELNASGYIRDYYNIYISGNGENEKDLVLSPSVSSGNMRIVLTWGSVPRDLDGHLEGKSSANKSVHVYWMRKNDPNDVANLDVDHIMGNGCETITINDIKGNYLYKVHRFSSDGAIPTSGAVVKVYTSDGQVRTFTPLSSTDAVLWEVFKIENETVVPISGNVE